MGGFAGELQVETSCEQRFKKKECRENWIIAKISRNNGRHTRATNSDDFEFLPTSLKFATVVKLFRCEDAVITIMVHTNGKTKTV